MAPSTFVLLSGALTFGVPLVLAVRELLLVDRGRGGPSGPERTLDLVPRPTPDDDADLPPLPDCLIPRLPAPGADRRRRVLEDA